MVTSVRILTFVAMMFCATSSAWAQEPLAEALGAQAGKLALGSRSGAASQDSSTVRTAGLRSRLKLRLRFDWIRSYTALGPHLYLAQLSSGARDTAAHEG